MSGFRCLALESGVRPPSVAACNGDRHFETQLPDAAKVAAALFEAIDEVLANVDLSLEDLDCIAFGRGPGAFTGLRVAAAAAQGLGAGLGIGLCAVSSLAALAQEVGDDLLSEAGLASQGAWIAPCLPAGRDQVYLGWYRVGKSGLVSTEAEDWLASAARCRLPGTERFIAAGTAWSGNEALNAANASRIEQLEPRALPRAGAVLRLARREYAEGRAVAPEQAQPVYLRKAV
ncbi:MAG: tRNA (adenosine(37)-N6)-threonylcarbamoyltransferase complex dimerization subunit type 1 TsaB [Gammaproteobacteria bacterium]|nr:tRNA (adenosine(37)-N6)-threonylcarbamoyltransferase complex dimerization subunit type 1 TsaB [Gammaproteobacteria bacterium]